MSLPLTQLAISVAQLWQPRLSRKKKRQLINNRSEAGHESCGAANANVHTSLIRHVG